MNVRILMIDDSSWVKLFYSMPISMKYEYQRIYLVYSQTENWWSHSLTLVCALSMIMNTISYWNVIGLGCYKIAIHKTTNFYIIV